MAAEHLRRGPGPQAPTVLPVPPPAMTRTPEPEAHAVPIPATPARTVPTRTIPIAAKAGVAKVAVAKRVETRHPLHIPVIAGISAGLYAGCLLVTSGLQFAADRELIADRQPMADAITLLQQDHEAMTAALQAATDRYNEAVDGYGALTSDREALQARLARLGRQVATIEGITITGPSLDWSTSLVQSPSRATTPKASGGTSKGATTTAPVAAAPAPAPIVVRAPTPAPPPPVAATTGASGKP